MYRPYVFSTMMVTIDGRINGGFYEVPEYAPARMPYWNDFFTPNNRHQNQVYMVGRNAIVQNFVNPGDPDLTPFKDAKVPEGDFFEGKEEGKVYLTGFTIFGNVNWQDTAIPYSTGAFTPLEIFTEDVGDDYKAYLRDRGISYIVAGKGDEIDLKLALQKLKGYGFDTVCLGGGGMLNWSFIQEGLCDELSFFIPPVGEGNSFEPSVFSTGPENKRNPIAFKFKGFEMYDGGVVHLSYDCPNSDEGWKDENEEEVTIVSAKPVDA